MLHLMQIHF